MANDEHALLASRQEEWRQAVQLSFYTTMGGLAFLLFITISSGLLASRDHRARQLQVWLREGQSGLGEKLQGEQRLDVLGERVLAYLARFLGAQVGAVYANMGPGGFVRIAGYALAPGRGQERVGEGDGLLGQAVKERRVIHVLEVPEGYLPVNSAIGQAEAREIVVAPAVVDGSVQAVMELGFFRRVRREERDLLDRISELFGIAVRSAKDRSRLEELLEETQRQAEELQAQQEELKVSNEELEEQSRALKESQARLETQQSELEQTNAQLEEQASLLEAQKDELARSQAGLAEKAAELERSNQYKSEFLANMSHELRTPLNSSLILSRLLADNKDGNLTQEQVKFARTISSANNDLLALINDILDLSKIESGKVELQPEAVTVASVLDTLQKTFQPVAQQKGLQFSASVAPNAPGRLETDPQRLGQILKNLLSNAFKFTERGEVSVRVSKTRDGMIAFAVKDTGIGIAEHQHDVIFEAFRQADGSTHRKYGGTGLGLSISRDLARLLGGDIGIESELGRGSTFTLKLPLAYAAPAEATGVPAPAAAPAAAAAPAPAGHGAEDHGAEDAG
jgi:signal transduction histidine kinase